MKALYVNQIAAATLSATSVNTLYPLSNLVHQFLRKIFKAASSSSTLTITFPAAVAVNCFYIGFHNIASLTLTFYDIDGISIYSQVFTSPADVFALHLSETYSVKSIRFQASCASGSILYVGGIAAGEEVTFPDPNSDFKPGYTDNSEASASPGGQTLANRFEPLVTDEFSFGPVTFEEKELVTACYCMVGLYGHLWLDAFEDNHDFHAPMYCTIESVPNPQREDGDYYTFTMTFKEAR